ncbi:peptide methionine sulfoxide reductase [Ferrimonas balearica DSM 9799]|uniref:Peptide methionine sulfoxide reductase MsrA n=1 Tax=Ferrimonas balearica (strain DSM 9799 / CCM 4581 / KCTC 23876 / PAT) TaxID=550540 RepID=E1SMQ0_FERBD|nr:bifunctional methionine sulfoxide reductase B/A protein [Ferrimonas balearica]ADN75589.1 peptide methionine sulfoxide reductase [Ferrimonas balearica DSM 9799]
MRQPPLTDDEQQVLEEKGTERPFSGRFLSLDDQGTYCCRRCQSPLFRSEHKFESGCGWPSFDDEIAGAVRRETDADGRRTEILCAQCGGHLGHVFEGEGLTAKNLRHCVNALSMSFAPSAEAGEQWAVFGGGCFWCLEALFQRLQGVSSVTSGYAGGEQERADYRSVCAGDSGHIEVIRIGFDPAIISFGQLLELFFDCHDPTSWDQQGADRGSQYRSAIFCQDDTQRQIAQQQITALEQLGRGRIVTELRGNEPFYPAESEHQNYFNQHSNQPYCHWNIKPKLAALMAKYSDRVRPEGGA